MQVILVTGGAGFIGGCLLVQACEARVINVDKLTYAGNLDSLAPVIDDPLHVFVQADIGDQALIERLLEAHRPLAIVNLAAESHVDRSIDGPAAFVETNVVGTFRLLEAVRQYWSQHPTEDARQLRFLHVSTDEVYGSLGPVGAFSETTP